MRLATDRYCGLFARRYPRPHARASGSAEEGARMAVSVETKPWTVEDLYRIPDDENRYEVLHGELLVTPPAGADHETAIARLHALLAPYVAANGLGIVSSGNPALHRNGSFLIPDLVVRQPPARKGQSWAEQPLPILVVEVRSPSTWTRDCIKKRAFYLD